MTEIIDKLFVAHHLQAMLHSAARIDRLLCPAAPKGAREHTRRGGSARIRSQEKSKTILEIPEIPENCRAPHPMSETATCGELDRSVKRRDASENCGNALIDESVEIPASDRGPCLPSQMALIARIVRRPRPCARQWTGIREATPGPPSVPGWRQPLSSGA
jgi:hypothetical protein